jgi:electron transfer flavoprotein alpha subunit
VAVEVALDAAADAVTLVERVKTEATGVRLEDAEIVISGGRGLQGPKDLKMFQTCGSAPLS